MTLYEHIDQDLLPNDIGGNGGTFAEIKQDWMKKIKSHRWELFFFMAELKSILFLIANDPLFCSDYLLDPKHWKIDETKRRNSNNNLTMENGIRSLSID